MTEQRTPSAAPLVAVSVGVLTYRRPDRLAATLAGVLAQVDRVASDGGFSPDVIVVDNDPERSAESAVATLAHPRLRYVSEPRPGIAAARNRALREAHDRRVMVFIDDDERPEPHWLSSLLVTWQETGATAVMGRVISDFAHDPSPWVLAGDFFWRPRMPTGTKIDVVAAGNLLLDLDQLRSFGLEFDESLGLGGGEDTLLSSGIRAAGGRMVWCDESAAVDFVPETRTTRRWVLTRAWSHGNTSVRVQLRAISGGRRALPIRLTAFVGGVARIVVGVLRFAWGLLSRSLRHQARGLRGVFRGAGMSAAAFGSYYEEYARSGA